MTEILMKFASFFLVIYSSLSFSATADHWERMQERTGVPDPTGVHHVREHAIAAYDSGDLKGAFGWFTKWAKEFGNPYGQFRLANMYFNGLGVAKDHEKAAAWFLESAKQGYRTSQDRLAMMYLKGQGVPQNFSNAAEWFRKAAEENAETNLKAEESNPESNVHSFQVTDIQTQSDAQISLAILYRDGRGVEQSDSIAFQWFRKAADQGDGFAQASIGEMYEAGRGTEQNVEEAYKWYRMAADQGDTVAQRHLARFYSEGIGVLKNESEANKWLRLAEEEE